MLDDALDYLGPYRRAIANHGPSFSALLYGSREMQQRRFEVLAGAVKLEGRQIADLGSGHGDLLAWMRDQSIDYASYVGVEALAPFDRVARERAPESDFPRASFMCADFVVNDTLLDELVAERGVDTIVAVGSLNTLDEARALALLERCWQALAPVPHGVLAFNFLSGGDDWPRPPTGLPRRDTRAWIDWALERTPQVMFCQHYLGAHDATLVLARAPDTSSRRAW